MTDLVSVITQPPIIASVIAQPTIVASVVQTGPQGLSSFNITELVVGNFTANTISGNTINGHLNKLGCTVVGDESSVAIGGNALDSYHPTFGHYSYSVAIGGSALASATTESRNNLAIGSSSLQATTGNLNVAVGTVALQGLTTGNENTSIGGYSGTGLTTGSQNIYIGVGAVAKLYLPTDITGGADTNSIVIGAGAASDGSNTTVIGNYNTTQTRIFGTLIDGNGNPVGGSGGGTTYTAGTGISIAGNVISSTVTSGTTYTAGTGISIAGNVISSTGGGSTYTAGTGISIAGNVISSTGGGSGGGSPFATDILVNGATVGVGGTSGGNPNNLAFGVTALANLPPDTGDYTRTFNIGVGANALQNLTLGTNNLAFGGLAMQYATTANGNSAFGAHCLQELTTGSDNTAVGTYIGETFGGPNSLTTGSRNTIIGNYAQVMNSTDNNSIIIGQGATGNGSYTTVIGSGSTSQTRIYGTLVNGTGTAYLLGSTSNNLITYPQTTMYGTSAGMQQRYIQNSTAIGVSSQFGSATVVSHTAGNLVIGQQYAITSLGDTAFNTIGAFGTPVVGSTFTANAVGSGTGVCALVSAYNTSVGQGSLSNVKGGMYNTAIGQGSGQGITTGKYNTSLGQASGQKVTTGTNNLALGAYAGFTNGTTTGSNNINIGYYASPSANSTTNEIVIGANAVGIGSNTAVIGSSTTSTTKLFGNLVIASTVPTSSVGTTGDKAGQFAFDASYIYTCVGNYDGTTTIWQRAATSTW